MNMRFGWTSAERRLGTRFPWCDHLRRSIDFKRLRKRKGNAALMRDAVSDISAQLIAAGILSGMQGKMGIAAWRWYAALSLSKTGWLTILKRQAVLHRGE